MMGNDREKIKKILHFWFGDLKKDEVPGDDKQKSWWMKDAEFDERIKNNFVNDLKMAIRGELDHWKTGPDSMLALIILLDQFSRNIYRDKSKAFSQDDQAIQICLEGIEKGFDKTLHPVERIFFYIPFMHSEDIDMQEKSLKYFSGLLEEYKEPESVADVVSNSYKFAVKHYDIIKRFGRYPHRNEILGRESTPEEKKFLEQPGSSF